MTMGDLSSIWCLVKKIQALPDNQLTHFATHLLDALADPDVNFAPDLFTSNHSPLQKRFRVFDVLELNLVRTMEEPHKFEFEKKITPLKVKITEQLEEKLTNFLTGLSNEEDVKEIIELHPRIVQCFPDQLLAFKQRISACLADAENPVSQYCLERWTLLPQIVCDSLNPTNKYLLYDYSVATDPVKDTAFLILSRLSYPGHYHPIKGLTDITIENRFESTFVKDVKNLSPEEKNILIGLAEYAADHQDEKNHSKLTDFFAYLKNNPSLSVTS